MKYNVVVDDNIIPPEEIITVMEAAQRLGRSVEQVRRYLREGKLRGRHIGQQWFIEEAALQAFYPSGHSSFRYIREAAATFEVTRTDTMTSRISEAEIEALAARIEARARVIAARSGGAELNIVNVLREERESH